MTEKRKPIRPAGDKTREKIIKAAKSLFAKHGFSGTSISQIADKAHINRSLIFHHFVNKEELWKVVKQFFFDAMEEHIEDLEQSTQQGLRHFIEVMVYYRFKIYEKNPDFMRMINWQHLEENVAELQGGTKLAVNYGLTSVEYLQKKGEINKNLDPNLIIVLIATTVSGPLMARPAIFKQKNKIQEYLTMLIDGLCKMLAP